MKEKIKWDNEKKVKLVQLEQQARNGGIRFMGRWKRAWDECYREFRYLTMQCLRDTAGRFKKDKTIKNLILVQNREEVIEQLIEVTNGINNEKMEAGEDRPGRESQDIMEQNEETSQDEIEVRGEMERVTTTTKEDIEERDRAMKEKKLKK